MTAETSGLTALWDKTLKDLKEQVSDQTFTAWFCPINPLAMDDQSITLGVPNDFFRDWVGERYQPLIKSTLSNIAGKNIDISLVIAPPQEMPDEKSPIDGQHKSKKGLFQSLFPKQKAMPAEHHKGLNAKYSFDTFVVGPSNRFAHAACLAVSESPAKTYNPIFIYGGVGLGKTHLMHSLGNHISQRFSRMQILYISSEEFTNQLISAIQTRSMGNFRRRYRNVDVLLIDDIHFIAGKESTQEEFFHTFNALYDAHKQIVMSSDRSPKEIPSLEERLVSRFEWGLVTDIQSPDFETRMAILKKKSEFDSVPVPNDVLVFLAENIKSNIRELEGGLVRVVAYSNLFSKPMSVDLAREVLKGMITEGTRKVNVDLIQKKVADYFNLSLNDMKAKKRTQNIAYPRQIAMYLSRDLTNLSLPEIGAYFGGRDHTTVIHACHKVENDLAKKEEIRTTVDRLREIIRS
ncbi:MAG: chromosomal replication initiator protein DnaA [Candidatus Omnitrophota bacterium]